VQPRPWLFAIADNVRRRRFRRAQPRALPLEAVPEPEAPVSPVEVRELVEALRRLPGAQREALVLREVGGLSYGEVAARMGTTESAVQMLLFRGRRALRNALRPGSAIAVPLSRLLQLLSPASESPLTGAIARAAGATAVAAVAVGVAGADSTHALRPDRWHPLPVRVHEAAVVSGRAERPPRTAPSTDLVVPPRRASLAPAEEDVQPGQRPAEAPASGGRAAVPAPAAPAAPVQQQPPAPAPPVAGLVPVVGPPAPVPQPTPPALPPSPPLPQLPQLTLPQAPQPPRLGG
jgi:predicted DNA-binding protein (UPF0251 family)